MYILANPLLMHNMKTYVSINIFCFVFYRNDPFRTQIRRVIFFINISLAGFFFSCRTCFSNLLPKRNITSRNVCVRIVKERNGKVTKNKWESKLTYPNVRWQRKMLKAIILPSLVNITKETIPRMIRVISSTLWTSYEKKKKRRHSHAWFLQSSASA